ncbi:MAG: DsrE family protein [Proteobacteria bacterium]|nr:DsrE family protein [Pseudomonadota bacterium]MBU1687825.1 DsrE family protein [Pseudomonadota bacterium]
MSKKMLVIVTHSTDDVDRANLALAFIAAMVAEEIDVAVLLMWEGALLGKKGVAETLEGRNMTHGKVLMPIIMEAKTPILVCAPCAKTMGVTEADLIDNAKLITAPTVIAEMQHREVVNF